MRFEISSEPAKDMPEGALQWRWQLVQGDFTVVARSVQVYATEAECRHSIALTQGAGYETPMTVVTWARSG